MAATFVSGATAADGANYTPGGGADLLLAWMATGYAAVTNTASAQTYNSVSMTERVDQTTNLTGSGDPVGMLADLVAPSAGSNVIDLTWSAALTNETGYAMTISGVDQTTPLASSGGATYAVDNSPAFTIDAPTNSCVVYFRHHAASLGGGTPAWTAPTGFTQRFANTLIATPAFREVRVYTRDVTTALTSHSLSATTTGTAMGGIHGYAVYNEAVAAGGSILPFITKYYRGLN